MLVDFIIPTYDRIMPIKSMLASLFAQTNPLWEAIVVIDDSYENKDDVYYLFDEYEERPSHRLKFIFAGKRYNDWGHTPREIGKQQSAADYVIMTGDDNYYTPNFVEELSKVTEDKPGMVYWDMVHSHYDYSYFKCSPNYNQIDMGAFAVRTDIAKQIPLGTEYAADGLFVEEFKRRFPYEKIVKIEKILFVHN